MMSKYTYDYEVKTLRKYTIECDRKLTIGEVNFVMLEVQTKTDLKEEGMTYKISLEDDAIVLITYATFLYGGDITTGKDNLLEEEDDE
tara:strand:+ start:4892 stop:5155 length:264 start_codon:yes stop_codon:yes gene_type:complete